MRRNQGGAAPGLIARPIGRWSAFLGALFFLFVLLPAFTLAPVAPDWAPTPLANWAFDARLAIGRPVTTISSLVQAVQSKPAVTLDRAGETVAFLSQGLSIVGTVYGAGNSTEARPGVLLLHGSTPQGRKLGMYRILGQKLAERGYVVLAIDQRGFGESDDPPDVSRPESFDFVADAQNGITYLTSLAGVDSERLYVLGHSFGGDVAMTTTTQDARVGKLVVIGPGRRFIERGGRENAPEFAYFKRREMRYMRLQQPIPTDVYLQYRPRLTIESHRAYFAEADHVPILLIDGELEAQEDQQFLQDAYEAMAGAKAYTTLANADHYANVANFGPALIYDEQAMEALVGVIDAFFLDG
ncbi:MAG TPA: alpha/beta fold hydrolase [Anaerolineae bacterium]